MLMAECQLLEIKLNRKVMFGGLFKSKSELEKLQEKYGKLMEESFKLSSQDRKKSDAKAAEAEEVMKKIEALRSK